MPRACQACLGETGSSAAEILKGGAFYRCPECELQYVDPLPPHVPVFQDFTETGCRAIQQIRETGDVLSCLTPNERFVLRELRRRVPSHAVVLELCCESGRFLAALRKCGFRPLGVDPLPAPITMLLENGFTVKTGSVDSIPEDWPDPDAVVILESLVRYPSPAELLKAVRNRFPKAPLFLSVPSPRRSLKVPEFYSKTDYPPHHLTRWGPKALLAVLKNAGYRGRCGVAHVDLHVCRGRWRNRILKLFLLLFLRSVGESQYSLIAMGEPVRPAPGRV